MIETNARPPTAPPAYDTVEQLSYQQNKYRTSEQHFGQLEVGMKLEYGDLENPNGCFYIASVG